MRTDKDFLFLRNNGKKISQIPESTAGKEKNTGKENSKSKEECAGKEEGASKKGNTGKESCQTQERDEHRPRTQISGQSVCYQTTKQIASF
jgi:hypothetical protein